MADVIAAAPAEASEPEVAAEPQLEAAAPEEAHKPGSIRRTVRKPGFQVNYDAPGQWNKFCQEKPAPRPAVQVSAPSPKKEKGRISKWQAERQCGSRRTSSPSLHPLAANSPRLLTLQRRPSSALSTVCRALHERSLAIQQKRAEVEAAERRAAHELRAQEHRQRVLSRVAAHEERLRAAAEERDAREQAYQELLSRTRECVASRVRCVNVWDLLLRVSDQMNPSVVRRCIPPAAVPATASTMGSQTQPIETSSEPVLY